jgi:ArsR family transcriptional regulator
MKTLQSTDTKIADAFNALAHPSRLEILEILREGEACVCHIQAMLSQRQAYVSQHLNVLRNAGLVTSRKEGLRVYYQVSDAQIFGLIDGMKTCLQSSGDILLQEAEKKPQLPCTCPQCLDKQTRPSLERSRA